MVRLGCRTVRCFWNFIQFFTMFRYFLRYSVMVKTASTFQNISEYDFLWFSEIWRWCEKLRDFLKYFYNDEKQRNIFWYDSEIFYCDMKNCEIFWDILRYWNLFLALEKIQNMIFMKFEILEDFPIFSEIFCDVVKNCEIFWDILRCWKLVKYFLIRF